MNGWEFLDKWLPGLIVVAVIVTIVNQVAKTVATWFEEREKTKRAHILRGADPTQL